jgi:hypothetical protein
MLRDNCQLPRLSLCSLQKNRKLFWTTHGNSREKVPVYHEQQLRLTNMSDSKTSFGSEALFSAYDCLAECVVNKTDLVKVFISWVNKFRY